MSFPSAGKAALGAFGAAILWVLSRWDDATLHMEGESVEDRQGRTLRE